MIWALLALLGIPIWLIIGALLATLMQRRRVLAAEGVFYYRVRTDKGWSRTKGVARWVSDVLIRYKGIALLRTDANQVTEIEVTGPIDGPVRGLGDDAVELRLVLADRGPIRIAVAGEALSAAQGGLAGSPAP